MSKLFLVPTPVGNLEDITLRALRILKQADIILAEDTRKTKNLLKHFEIENTIFSHHKFNEHKTVDHLVSLLQSGKMIALVTDAGTPGISDPGFLLVRTAIQAAVDVECLPGATAMIPALVDSGLPCDRFCFEGFLPQKKGRQKRLQELAEETRTMVFYESPYRIVKTLQQFADFFEKDRRASVSREISKVYEETIRGTLDNLVEHFTQHPPKGEFVIVVEGKS
jgi:16S rRNA (cytidine1402-2'-O)-methyltransferase